MEKTSREYAAKLAKLKYKTATERSVAIDFYIKAVEETNVKELREALGELVYELTGDQEDEQELEKGLGITLAMRVARAINALNKTKS